MKKKMLFLGILLLTLILVVALILIKKPTSKVDQIMSADKGFNFPPGFPPDPGEGGKKTLKGIDSDHDGLRDDLQRWIYARFPNDPKKRAALKQMAISFQSGLFIHHDQEEIEEATKKSDKAITCLFVIFGDENNEMEFVRAKVLNTSERTKRHLEIDRWYDGMTFESSYPRDGTACEN